MLVGFQPAAVIQVKSCQRADWWYPALKQGPRPELLVSVGFGDVLQSGTKAALLSFRWEGELSETCLLALSFDIKS